jgi:hypothetical protein
MRDYFLAAMMISAAAVIATMLVLYVQLGRFQHRRPALHHGDDLTAFKSLAARQMYASLAGLILTWVPLALWVLGKFVFGVLGWLDALLYVILPVLLQFGVAAMTVGRARAVRETPADNPTIKTERDRVVEVWLHRSVPNW